MTKTMCNCDEGFIQLARISADGVKIAEVRAPLVHDCEYIASRNALIPAAERRADSQIKHLDSVPRARAFTAPFMAAMDALWAKVR